jgi:hypothetical protein
MTSTASMTSVASFHQKHLLSMMLSLTWQQNDLSWSSQCGMDHQKPTILWIFGTLSVGGCGGHGCYFQPNSMVISQISAPHKYTDIVFMT